ncbi:hypothetical protein AKJ37_03495 [candidate division MSBL1 archaeon SCGC-AAA259I09]|uniref:GTPase n=4 Tax=candidate division MSBL1 TaxID=215777 RepID=A0A133USJ1_9EURY|nr:hypothetical protein AKJ61_03775 [candidate division MSBL1 archaeon SCGC-AAA259B11]KXA89507.1 hypothetical protein AKJ62_02985 [candidate division MSBL1 archaeon SCGC-AAA259D14]KXA97185.1 hypothetical protein AKJ37_03495 [candidate division MSBL1 archaeon SCGC-AAA259I09]KXA98600.1 hypothetical protein AKJ39_01435 [candidate division MSBL1 archaeon SCGC-AAA259J03]
MYILIVGPAGSGKSLLTSEFGQYLENYYSVRYINLDSGAIRVPFKPDFDIRDFYTLEEIMKEKNLGPNGATLEAVDRLSEIDFPQYEEDFTLLDAPGQLEPFVFRGGVEVFRSFTDGCIYLVDGTAPLKTFPSQYLYSLATQYALEMPMIRALNKIDLLDPKKIEELERMMTDPRMFQNIEDIGMRSQMNIDIADLLMKIYTPSSFPAISAKTQEGFENLATLLFETTKTDHDTAAKFSLTES